MSFGGLDPKLRYYEFQLDSFAADYGNSSSETVLNWPIFQIGGKKALENIAGVKILEVQIPFSWYIVNSYNNVFTLLENSGGNTIVTIPVGNYTSGTLTTALQLALRAASFNTRLYVVSYNSTIGKFSIINGEATSSPFSFLFGNSVIGDNSTSPIEILGFNRGTVTSVFGSAANTLDAPNIANITGPNYLYVNSTKLGNLTDMYLPKTADNSTNGNSGPEMAKVPIGVQPGGTILWTDPSPTMFFDLENLSSLTEIDFFLTLGNSKQVLRLNGLSFSLKLGILVNEYTQNTVSSGSVANGRVVNRISKR